MKQCVCSLHNNTLHQTLYKLELCVQRTVYHYSSLARTPVSCQAVYTMKMTTQQDQYMLFTMRWDALCQETNNALSLPCSQMNRQPSCVCVLTGKLGQTPHFLYGDVAVRQYQVWIQAICWRSSAACFPSHVICNLLKCRFYVCSRGGHNCAGQNIPKLDVSAGWQLPWAFRSEARHHCGPKRRDPCLCVAAENLMLSLSITRADCSGCHHKEVMRAAEIDSVLDLDSFICMLLIRRCPYIAWTVQKMSLVNFWPG